jgi:Ca2+-binding EF-hand superfamily protein
LKNKLAQKASGTTSEETVLMKSFKYFDLNNNGTVEPEEFAKAIEKIGIMIPTK